LLTPERLTTYAEEDRIGRLLKDEAQAGDETFTAHRWLQDSPAKRLMYECVYGDLMREDAPRRRVLDVGGGASALTRRLVARHDYTLLELNAHDPAAALRRMEDALRRRFWVEGDWYGYGERGPWDVVVANDLFPNVDQRMAMFLDKFVELAVEIRLSLTYYDEPRFYLARRLEGDEVLCVLAWNGEQTRRVLASYRHRLLTGDGALPSEAVSVFPNGRQVLIAHLRGDAS